MVVTTMTILVTSGIYNVVIWTTKSCSLNQSQMVITISFLVVNATSWHCDVKCYELKQFMQQNDLEFINIWINCQHYHKILNMLNLLIRFVSNYHQQTILNHTCFTQMLKHQHNRNKFEKTNGQTFTFLAQGIILTHVLLILDY
jgi:hypothetical protein